jgi:orotidine-5'-phosphate decarboxylase
MNKQQLFQQIQQKQSFLCVGLDTDIQKIPAHLLSSEDPIFEFNKQIIDATIEYAVAYKPNTAFYESQGSKGWDSLQKTLEYLPQNVFKIADAKRGDIGNTSELYAKAFFEQLQADAVTVAPYMGIDSVKPFLNFPDKWVILLALTSNTGATDFQLQTLQRQQPLYEKVIQTSMRWANSEQMMYVVGATQASYFQQIRQLVPEHFLLVPGVGAQGGDLTMVAKYGLNTTCGLLVNSSRGIIYADNSVNFAQIAAKEAQKIQKEMANLLETYL